MKKLLSTLLSTMLITTALSAPVQAVVDYGAEYQNQPTAVYTQVFKDVSQSHWAFSYIGEMNSRGVVSGYPNGYFYPENNVTRAEFAKIMTVASSLPLDTTSGGVFADVGENDWFKPYVYTAQYYLCGYNMNGGVYYLPNTNALREDIAVALVKLKGYDTTGYDESMLKAMFKDYLSISDYARPYVATALEKGLISGYEDNTFRGQNSITRAEAATLLWRAYQYGSGNKVSTDMTPYVPTATPASSTSVAAPVPTPTIASTPTPTPVPTIAPTPTPTPEPEYTWSVDTLVDDVEGISRMEYYKDGIMYVTEDSVVTVDADGNREVVFNTEDISEVVIDKFKENLSKLKRNDFKLTLNDAAVNYYTNDIYALFSDNMSGNYLYNINTEEFFEFNNLQYHYTIVTRVYSFFSNGDCIIYDDNYNYIAELSDDGYATISGFECTWSPGVKGNLRSSSGCYVINDDMYHELSKYNWSISDFEELDVDNKGYYIANSSEYIYTKHNDNLYKMDTNGDSELILSKADLIEVKDRKSLDIEYIYSTNFPHSSAHLYAINDDDTIFFYDDNSIRMMERL